MNNDTNTTTAINDTAITKDPWALFVHEQDEEWNSAFLLFLLLGISTLCCCIYTTIRLRRKRETRVGGGCSFLCMSVLFFSLLTAGFFSLSIYFSREESTSWFTTTPEEYTHHGQVRIVDTNITFESNVNGTTTTSLSSDTKERFVARARVVFGDEHDGEDERNATTFCNVYTIIHDCSRVVVCNDTTSTRANCSQKEKRQAANTSATACLANLTRGFEMPIQHVSTLLNLSIPPIKDASFPFLDGYWNDNTCAFTDVTGYKAQQEEALSSNKTTTLRSTGIGLACGAVAVLVVWIIMKAGIWLCCPTDLYFEPQDDDSDWGDEVDEWVATEQQHPSRIRTKRFFEKQFVRSKQWIKGYPLPQAYSPDDDFGDALDTYYGTKQQRDGLSKVIVTKDENNGDIEMEQEDEVPDYWKQWNEGKQTEMT